MTIYLLAGGRIAQLLIPQWLIAGVIGGIIALVIRQLWHVDWKHFWG
jgi:hypothetical protein